MTSRNTNASLAGINSYSSGFRNKLINGDFAIWQRAGSQTAAGYGSDDRWNNSHTGSSKTHSAQAFTLGQTEVPGNPIYFSRTVITSVAGASNYTMKQQTIEDVRLLQAKRVTLTFYARADTTRNMTSEFAQSFGSGGSTSVEAIGVRVHALTTIWKKFTYTIDMPSITGKILGAGADNCLILRLWFEAGSTYAVQSGGIGQQSGTFDIAHISLVEGDATIEDDPFSARHIQQELSLCYRYYEPGRTNIRTDFALGGSTVTQSIFNPYRAVKRVTPSIGLINHAGSNYSGSPAVSVVSAEGFAHLISWTNGTIAVTRESAAVWAIDAEL